MTDRPDQPSPGSHLPSTGAPSSRGALPPADALPWATAAPVTVADPGMADPSMADPSVADPGVGDPGAADGDLDLLEPAWAPPPRANRWTVLLAGGLVAALGFGAGVLVQKNHDAGLVGSSAGAGAAARAFARANGFGGAGGAGGAQGGFGGMPGVSGGRDGQVGGPGAGSGGGPGAASGTPVVVGTVVSVGAGTLVVQNFAGTKVSVTVPEGTPVTTAGLAGLKAGATVSVTGTKAADGSVTATSVTSRRRG